MSDPAAKNQLLWLGLEHSEVLGLGPGPLLKAHGIRMGQWGREIASQRQGQDPFTIRRRPDGVGRPKQR